jgi:putative transposase
MVHIFVFQKLLQQNSSDEVVVKLTTKRIRWAIDQVITHQKSTKSVAKACNVTQRRIQQLVKVYRDTGKYPTLNPKRRPKTCLSHEEKRIIEKAYKESSLGARLLRHHIKKHYNVSISQNKIHAYLRERGYAHPNPNKQKKRTLKHQRIYSLSLVHAGWLHYRRRTVIAYLDDISRYLVALGEFEEATSENALGVLKEAEYAAESVNSMLCVISTNGGSQSTHDEGNTSQFMKYLERKGIDYMHQKKNLQTTGKLDRWFREYKRHRKRFKSPEEFRDWYNRRIHGSLNLEIGETPQEAFIRKLHPQSLCGMFWRRVEG